MSRDASRAGVGPRLKLIVLALLVLFNTGCAGAPLPFLRSGHEHDGPYEPQDRSPAHSTLGTDSRKVPPGTTITPPSLGVDLTSTAPSSKPSRPNRASPGSHACVSKNCLG